MIIPVANRLNKVEDYYFVKKLEEIRKLNENGHDVINFGIGSPDVKPSGPTVEALVESARKDTTHGYQAYRGIPQLRAAMSAFYHQTYGVKLQPDTEILPLLGSKEGILHISMAFLNAGDKVLVPNPGYPAYTSVSNLIGAEIVYYDLKEENNWYPDFEALDKADLKGVKIMWVNYPHMPTGAPASQQVFEKLVAFARNKHILLCHDNPYSLMLNTRKPCSLLGVPGADEVAIELNSMSKSFNMAGWRVGMVCGRAEYLSAILRVKSNIDSGMFLPVQMATVEALANTSEWHAERNAVYRDRRDLIFKILADLGFDFDPGQEGLFVWAKAPDSIQDIPGYVDQLLYEKHVFFTPGEIFGSNGNRFLRASLCVPSQRIREAASRLGVVV